MNDLHTSCTLAAYAAAKKLPEEFLTKLGIREQKYQGSIALRIPYLDEEGQEVAVRFRTSLVKAPDGVDNRFRWRTGSKTLPYGLWRLKEARERGFVILVEGESDCHVLWHQEYPALGLPGASNWKERWAEYLKDMPKIYAWIEPDKGGQTMLKKLIKSEIRDRLYIVNLKDVEK